MVNLRGTRRFRLAVELICEKLEINDSDLNDYIKNKKRSNSPAKAEEPALNVVKTAELINAVTDLEGLKEFESDERKGVINAVAAKKLELEKEQ